MDNFSELIQRSYNATRNRGLITDETNTVDFIDKMEEEFTEVMCANTFEHEVEETIDLISVCLNILKHNDIDFIKAFEKCIEFQETRKD